MSVSQQTRHSLELEVSSVPHPPAQLCPVPTQHRTGVPASFVVHPTEEFVISGLSCVAAVYPQRQLWVFIVFIESRSCDSNKLFCHNHWITHLAEFSQEKSLKCWKSSSDISSVYTSNVNYTKVSSRKVKRRKNSSAGIWEELLGFGNIFLLDFYLIIWNKGIFYKDVNVCSIFNLFSLMFVSISPSHFF